MAAAVAVLLIVGGAGWYFQHSQDNPVREAFGRSHAGFTTATEHLESATTLEEVAQAGESYAVALPLLRTASAEASGRDSEVAAAARRAVTRQIAVAEAGSLLATISERNIEPWTQAREPLSTAVAALAQRRADVERLGEDPSSLPASGVVAGVQDVVSEAASASVGNTLKRIFTRMDSAGRTGQLRNVGETAQVTLTAIEAATPPTSSATAPDAQLTAYAPVLASLSKLSTVDGRRLGEWTPIRAELQKSLQALPAKDPSKQRGQAALGSVDRLIERAIATIATWQARYDAVSAQRRESSTGLDAYQQAMKVQQSSYSTLRRDLSSWFTEVGSQKVSSDQAIAALSTATEEREAVRDAMTALTVPSGVATAHATLVGVVESAAVAVGQALETLTNDEQCQNACNYSNTESWQELSAASSGITSSYDSALKAWQDAVATTRKAGKALVLPKRPTV